MVYLITYDLNKPGQDYEKLYDVIKDSSTGAYFHLLDSTWIIKSNLTTGEISNNIKKEIDTGDHFIVIEVKDNKRGWLPKSTWTYLNDSIF